MVLGARHVYGEKTKEDGIRGCGMCKAGESTEMIIGVWWVKHG
jgi:hypothetical protein